MYLIKLPALLGQVILAVLIGGLTSAHAVPACTTTIVLPGGNGTILDSSIGAGVCVQSQDKLFGNFSLGNLPQPGSITFVFSPISGTEQHSNITFTDPFTPGNTYTDSFEVEVLNGGGFPTGNFITQLRADITQTQGGPTTLTQTTTPAPGSGSINLSKTGNVVSGSFINNYTAAQNVTDLLIASVLTTGAGSDASAILNTLIQSQLVSFVPLPSALPLFATGLVGLGLLGWRRKKRAIAA